MTPQSQAIHTNRVPGKQPYEIFQEETMIKVSVMYPNKPGGRFDHDYYSTKHLPLIKRRMGAGLKYYTIDRALMDSEGKPLGAYVAMCHLLCDSLDSYQASFGPHAHEIRGDVSNFTDGTSIHQISEVVVENSAIGIDGRLVENPVDQRSLPTPLSTILVDNQPEQATAVADAPSSNRLGA